MAAEACAGFSENHHLTIWVYCHGKQYAYLVDLSAIEQELLILTAEADLIPYCLQLKNAHCDAPKPQHGDHNDKRLVVGVEELHVGLVRIAERRYDHRQAYCQP